MQENIYAFVRQQEVLYRSGSTKISKYVNHSLSETVQTIYAYLNSKHTSGEQDSLGRDKPFFNVVIAARNIWFRATEIARKNIVIRETNSKAMVAVFLATQYLQEWMRKMRFGVFLADWGLTLAGFGSAVSKWVEQNGELIPTVVPWNQIICDTIDFDSNPKIEIFEFTASQLRAEAKKKGYDTKVVESIIQAPMVRMTITQDLQDVKPYYFKIYEVHGQFPVSYLTDRPEDKYDYSQQMHVVSYVRSQGDSSKYDNFSLYRGKETKDPYHKDDLLKEDGRTLAIGAVEHLFQSQWMINHSVKAIKDQLDLTSKLVFQTSDPAFVGQNVLTNIENGQILNHKINEPLSAVPNGSHDVASLVTYMEQWKAIGQEVNGVTDAMIGTRPHQGTSWKLQNLEVQQSQALFDLMRRNKGLAIEDMLRENIIPFIKKQLAHRKEIVATLDAHNIKKIDGLYVPQEAIKRYNAKVIDHVLKNGTRPDANLQNELGQVQGEQSQLGNTRYFTPSEITDKTWKQIFKDLEWEVEVDVTGEESDKQAILQTLNSALQIVVSPGYAQSPQAQMIVAKILSQVQGFSPLELAATPATNVPPQQTTPTPPQKPQVSSPPSARALVGTPNLSAVK